ncbi:MAG: hypothetical protein WC644_05225 [Ignavibacteria bacterium]
MKNIIPLLLAAFFALSLYSCSSDETVISNTSDTLSYSFSNLNDSVITITYAIGGVTSSQPVSWTVNLNKSILKLRHNMTYKNSDASSTMTVNSYSDTTRRFSFPMSTVNDSLRPSFPGPSTKIELVPTNFKGRGTITVAK